MFMTTYDPKRDGGVIAIRIYEEEGNETHPQADLVFAFGGTRTITWTNMEERESFHEGINGYTVFFDEREHPTFEDFVNKNKKSIIPDTEHIGPGELWLNWPNKN
jgi:hypothetical protein